MLNEVAATDADLERSEVECVETNTAFIVGNRYWLFVWDKNNVAPGVSKMFKGKGTLGNKGKIDDDWLHIVFPMKIFSPCEEIHPCKKDLRNGVLFFLDETSRKQAFKKEYITAMYTIFGRPRTHMALKATNGKRYGYLAVRSREDGSVVCAIAPKIV